MLRLSGTPSRKRSFIFHKSDTGYLGFLRRNPAFRRLWLAQLISQTGDRASVVALLALTLGLTGSGFVAGAILAANMLSPLLVFPLVSVVVDRFSRKRLMIAADVVAACMALSMMLVTSEGTIWVGIVAALGIAAMDAFSTPAAQAALPNLVDPPDLGRANALLASSQGITLGIGPVVGGVAAASVGYDAAFVGNALSFAVSAALVLSIGRNFTKATSDSVSTRSFAEIRKGLAYVRSRPPVAALLTMKSIFALTGGGAFVLLPVFATQVFEAGGFGIGVLMAARGLGALLGPFGARAVIGESETRLFVTIGLCAGLFGGAYLLFAATPSIWFALPLVIVAHTGGFALWTMESYGVQRLCADQFRGRAFTLDYTLATSMMAISMLATGKLVASVGPRTLMAAEAVALLLGAAAWTLATRPVWRGARERRLPGVRG